MLFNSTQFFIFFPIVVLIYLVIPKKIKYIWLLICSYYFYMCWNAKYVFLIATSTIITYGSGRLIEHYRDKNNGNAKKIVVLLSLISNLGILIIFKYLDWLLGNLNILIRKDFSLPFSLVLPVGISFYTFQALSYTIDVYRGNVKSEKNILKYALFVSFFPQLVAGPIERSKNLITQINRLSYERMWSYNQIMQGIITMTWGYFLKLVIADRIGLLVDNVFDHYYMYDTIALIIGVIGFSIQIYCDFESYSTIAIGAARIMGFELMENFNTPYFSNSVQDFWRRWHISLSTWFRDYLYIPLGGNRYGKVRKYINIFITFIISGLWHGSNWHYVVWGAIHGIYQILELITIKWRSKLNCFFNIKTDTITHQIGKIFLTDILIGGAWIFFRARTLKDAIIYIKRIFTQLDLWTLYDGGIFELGLNRFQMDILFFSLLILFLVGLIKRITGKSISEFLYTQGFVYRFLITLLLFIMIFIFGEYGVGFDAQQFIYFQF